MRPSDLPWLPAPPSDFRQQCEQIDHGSGPRGERLVRLAQHALGDVHLARLARSLSVARESGRDAPLARMVLGLVSNGTTDFIAPALAATALRHGISLQVAPASFGVTLQAALDPASEVVQADPDAILLALDYRAYFPYYVLADSADAAVDAAVGYLLKTTEAFQAASRAVLLVQTLAAPPERLFGSFDRRQPGTAPWLAARFNERLIADIVGPGICLFDVEGLATQIGLAAWYDRSQHMTARLPFASTCVPLYAEHAARLLAAMRGRSRKVLVLDLDNTLWGGVIGDDGIEGIRLGQGDPRGEAFLDLQRAALALKRRGILLAICSKNDEAVALRAIREHPEMVLRESDFTAFQINWSDKATNLEILAKRLSLGLDSFVFLDDNPVERAQVRQALPMVCVPELSSDPATYGRALMTGGYFEAITFSAEDRARAEQYAANTRRETLLAQSRDLESFLISLSMEVSYIADGTTGWARFTQLINKSNQFNLTTRRYTEAEVTALAADPAVLKLQVRLKDQFGDNGMISAIIARPHDRDWVLDTWVMSCRVLGRRVEEAVLNEIARRARDHGIHRLIGVYRPTERNGLVREHYRKLGFTLLSTTTTEERWALNMSTFESSAVPIAVANELAPA